MSFPRSIVVPVPVQADVVVPVRADVVVPVRPGRRGRRQSRDEPLLYSIRNFKFRASFVKRRCQLFLYFYQIGSCDLLKTAQTGAHLRRTGCERASRCDRADVVGGKVEMSRFCTPFTTLIFM